MSTSKPMTRSGCCGSASTNGAPPSASPPQRKGGGCCARIVAPSTTVATMTAPARRTKGECPLGEGPDRADDDRNRRQERESADQLHRRHHRRVAVPQPALQRLQIPDETGQNHDQRQLQVKLPGHVRDVAEPAPL